MQAGKERGKQNLACVRASGGRKNEGLRFMVRQWRLPENSWEQLGREETKEAPAEKVT